MDSLETHEQPTTKANTTTTKENITTKKNETTTVQPVVKPTEVIGLTLNEQKDGTVKYSWGQTEEQIASGQIYKVYIDGKYVESYNLATTASYTFTTNGNHTIKITANLNGYETEGKVLNVVITGLNTPTTVTTTKATETNPGTTTDGLSSRLMIGYYHTWNNDGNPFIKLRDVDKNWDVINISFAEPVQAGSTDGKMQFNISGLSSTYTKEDFKKDVKNLQAQGKKIVLSIGGYEGYFSLTSDSAVNQFVSDIKSIVNEYGFDGIDIDLEQSSVQFESGNDKDINNPTSPKVVNMIKAIRTICNSYGDDFILSWAPETFYVQLGYSFYGGINQYCDARAGVYLPMINALRDKTSYVHVQLYNSAAITGLDGTAYNMGTKEGIVAMCEMLLKGFHVGAYYTNSTDASTYFAPLRPDQVVIGVPSSQGAAGSGQVANSVLQSAFTELNNNYPGIRGIMAWSINWDSSQNNNSFVDENAAFLETLKNDKPTTVAPTTKETPVVPTTVAPTVVTTTVAPTTTVTEDDTIPAPIGLTYAGNETLPYYFAWQSPANDIESYNVYVDGRLVATSNIAAINLTADAFANGNGDYVVSVKSVRNGKESKATSITYAYTGGTVDKPTTVAPTTTVAATTVAPTTVAPTTTVAATTVVPTTVVPTTVAPTTVAPTTAIEDDTIPAPIGLTYAGNDALPYYFAWQSPASDIESYNVYVDGRLVATSNIAAINLTADAFANGNGDYVVSVKSVRNGKESKATSITYTYTGGTVDKPTTVAPNTTVAATTVAPTTVAPTTTVAATTVAPTTVAPTTTVTPTTVAPTTVAPTTVVPTTVVPTTVVPTTVAPTTAIEDDTIPAPIGLTYAGNDALPYYFAWQAPVGDIESYNVYVDGKLVATSGTPSINLTADAFASGNGDYTVSVKSVRNGKESKATSINYTYTGGTVDKPTTVAPATTVTPTTVVPTTVAPTTEAPTTVAPTTVAPTTEAPTTVAPTTVAPTTVAPTTVAPTTVAPTTVAPTTVAPTTVAPTTVAPTTEAPTTVAPTTEAPTTMAPTTQSETSTVAIGEGSNAGKVDSEILNCKNDKDLAGSTFGKLCVKVKKSKKKAISLTWKNIQVAKTYVIYGAKCGTSYKKIATVHSKTFTNKKLKKGTYYKYMVVALNEKGEVVAISKLIHVATKGGKVGNCKKLKVNKSKVNLKQGKKFKLKVKQIAELKKVKVKNHRKIAFESDNQDVAVVSKKGVITAKKKGKCSVYVYAQNGVYKQVKVTVK